MNVTGLTVFVMQTYGSSFEDVLNYFGGQERLAKALGCQRTAITQWKGVIPKLRTYQIEVITNGRFRARDLPTRVNEAG
jgi:hypothetical protein